MILAVFRHKKIYLDFQGSGDLELPKLKQPSFQFSCWLPYRNLTEKASLELDPTKSQMTGQHCQVALRKCLTLMKRLESFGGRFPPSSMWYFIRKPIPLMPLTAMGIFNIKIKIGVTTAEFSGLYNCAHRHID